MSRQHWFWLVIAACLVLFCRCDPGTSYVPLTGKLIDDYTWEISTEDFVIMLIEPSFFSGSRALTPEPTIQNISGEQVRLDKVILSSNGEVHLGQMGDGGPVILEPGESRRLPLLFSFDKKVPDALGRLIEISVDYTVGSQSKTVRLSLNRA